LGALAHYAGDNNGHRTAVNVSVPLLYPNLRLKFGKRITYADDPFSHTKTEFGFDVFQAAKGHYASDAYKGFIGFQVAKPLLQRAFQDTYGIRIEQVFFDLDLAIGSYRRAVGTVLPALTKVAWQMKSQEIGSRDSSRPASPYWSARPALSKSSSKCMVSGYPGTCDQFRPVSCLARPSWTFSFRITNSIEIQRHRSEQRRPTGGPLKPTSRAAENWLRFPTFQSLAATRRRPPRRPRHSESF